MLPVRSKTVQGNAAARWDSPTRGRGREHAKVQTHPSPAALNFFCPSEHAECLQGLGTQPQAARCCRQALAQWKQCVNISRAFEKSRKRLWTHHSHSDAGSIIRCSSAYGGKATLLSLLCVHRAAGQKH